MNKSEVLSLLKEHKNETGINNWNEMEAHKCQLKSFGIGLTVQRKLAKQIGKSHDLAIELWNSDYYDAKVISVLIDDPKLITQQQMESQVENIDFGLMVHVFSACGAPVAKTAFIAELASKWIENSDPVRQRCGYGFIYELSKSKTKSAPDDGYFLKHINHIEQSFKQESNAIRMSMAGALLGIGKRNLILNRAALKVGDKIGPVPVESGKSKCEPFDVSKHLSSDYLTKKFNS